MSSGKWKSGKRNNWKLNNGKLNSRKLNSRKLDSEKLYNGKWNMKKDLVKFKKVFIYQEVHSIIFMQDNIK